MERPQRMMDKMETTMTRLSTIVVSLLPRTPESVCVCVCVGEGGLLFM